MLFIPESFMFFSESCDHVTVTGVTFLLHLVNCVTVICDIILYPLPKSKRKEKNFNN